MNTRMLWLALFGTAALAQTPPAPYLEPVLAPEAGRYMCQIIALFPAVKISPNSPDTTITPLPSALGSLTLDGKGQYQLSSGPSGKYQFNAREGKLTFTGELGSMRNIYKVADGAFEITFVYQPNPRESPQDHICTLRSKRAVPPKVANLNAGLRGTLVGSSGSGANVVNSSVVEFDINTAQGRVRFAGAEAYRAENGETVYVNPQKNLVLAKTDGTTAAIFDTSNQGRSDNGLSTPLHPALAPDGSKIAYADHLSVMNATMGTIDRDGFSRVVVLARNGRPLTSFPGLTQPTWTKDGRLVMVGSKAENVADNQAKTGLYITDPSLSRVTRFDPNLDNPQMPAARPDGSLVLFVYGNALWVVGLNGQGLRKLEDRTRIFWPAWSPDGKHLAAWANVAYDQYRLAFMAFDGKTPAQAFTDVYGNPIEGYPNRFSWR